MNIETETENGTHFEVSYLERSEGASGLKAAIERHRGRVIAEKPLEKVRLSYPIKKQSYAFLGCVEFTMEPAELAEFQAELRLSGEMLRMLLHRAEHPDVGSARETPKPAAAPRVQPPRPVRQKEEPTLLTNEALEKKIEEILQ